MYFEGVLGVNAAIYTHFWNLIFPEKTEKKKKKQYVPCACGDFACLVRRHPSQSKTSFSRLMRTPKIVSLFLPRKKFPFV
jgi:hypothetical protein